ncbi:MAG: sigma-70 family RNA polymerase sigma factor [Sphingomonadaceae bacterium]|nr:sigma-70 family RNA polymerase sigma factor [Sphingomonadaceae bacterium]MCB2086788.1 sigma-70 family RNA polymerase sigma factor [Sphingomonadaceae bacterium]MCP5383286.1 sigma-70 family RNA polymerase sigma factor [Altererythrobacter sp.]MCP5393463.1 sigma-70 family RNA polymerase sigma factor [Sphingomonadaceae bacterium]
MTSKAKDESEGLPTREEFFARYERPLRSFFAKRLDDRQEVDDLVQEFFARLWSSDNPSELSNPDAYIFQAAANLLRERYRKAKVRQDAAPTIQFSQNTVEDFTPERILQGKNELQLLEKSLAELPERTRTVFLFHRFEKMKYREIASRLEVSVSAVEKHIAAAMKHLLKRMADRP